MDYFSAAIQHAFGSHRAVSDGLVLLEFGRERRIEKHLMLVARLDLGVNSYWQLAGYINHDISVARLKFALVRRFRRGHKPGRDPTRAGGGLYCAVHLRQVNTAPICFQIRWP